MPTKLEAGEPLSLLRTPPHNVEVERALLGAILLNNYSYDRVRDFLLPDHFTEAVNGRIYTALGTLIEKGSHASAVTLKTYLERDDLVITAGGMKYLASLSSNMVTVINVADYGKLIYDLHLRRELIALGEDMVNSAFDAQIDETAQDQIEIAESRLFGLADIGEQGGPQNFDDALKAAVDLAEIAHRRRGALAGIPTGLTDLDEKLGGLHDSDLVIIASRPGMGKTALGTCLAVSAARCFASPKREEHKNKTVLFFSLEMSADQIGNRVMAEGAQVDSHRIRTGKLSDQDFGSFVVAIQNLTGLPLKIDDTAALTVAAIRSRTRRVARKQGVGLIVVDYLQLISPAGNKAGENRNQEISAISRGLKAIAKEFKVPVIALSQLSRAVEQREDKHPLLSDLRDSGSIEQDADMVMFLYRDEYYARLENDEERIEQTKNLAEIIVAKQRHGPTGVVHVRFGAENTSFTDLMVANYDG